MQGLDIATIANSSMELTLLVLIIGGLLTLITGQRSEKVGQLMAAISLAGAILLNVILLIQVQHGAFIFQSYVWLAIDTTPILTLGFLADGLSVPVVLLITGLGFFSTLFSFSYMKDLKNPGVYYSLLVWFIAAMVGVIYATNLMQFFLFYELMLIPAFILVYLYGVSEDPEKRSRNALQFWVWTAVGGLISLVAVFIIFSQTGTMEYVTQTSPTTLAYLSTSGIATEVAKLIGLIFLLGFGIKLGLVPLHVWAPPVYGEAPMPVLVLLSGAMTKTAAYGVIRIVIPLFGTALSAYSTGLMVISIITMFYGAMLAISQKDLKMMLAYSSISQLGYLMLGYSSMTVIGVNGAAFQLINHGVLASLMFFCAGAIKLRTGTMEFDKLGGLGPKMPYLATIAIIGSLALAGTPPLSAFAGEWMIFAGVAELAISSGVLALVALTVIAVVATGLTAAYYLWAVRRIFYGPVLQELENVNDPPRMILFIGVVLVLFVVVIGIYPWLLWRWVSPALDLITGVLGG
ncbi:MAG: NADH-quinone oxidoreductase subunit M [Candidatus Thorarchaeota archaeon]|nr:NADH-quinone oxidoreductase subunit M [Candidatus Thorarchaeota archaeon]